MRKYPGIPELLEQLMKESAEDEKWVTVSELRQRFNLTPYRANTISGFLGRLKSGTSGQFPFIVAKIEKTDGEKPSAPKKCRYLLKLREWTPGVQPKSRSEQKYQQSFRTSCTRTR